MFKTSLSNNKEFTITYELVPGHGSGGRQVDRLLDFAEKAKADGRIKALSVTDNPGGNPALAPVAIGTELQQIGVEPLIHFSLKDKNRNQVESHIFLYQRLKMHSLLVLGGDFPSSGYYGQAKPVFDLDTIQTLQLMEDMENGSYQNPGGERRDSNPLPVLFKGCVVSPFKTSEAEQVWQYAKLLHKVKAGADFIITQLGFDMRKYSELMTFLDQKEIRLPVLANVFIPSLKLAQAMANGKVPGVLFGEELVAEMKREAASGESRARLDRAAAIIVSLKRFGYQGVHIGGNCLDFGDIRYVMDRVEQVKDREDLLGVKYDFPVKNNWYFYKASSNPPDMEDLRPGTRKGSAKIHAIIHDLFFSSQTASGRLFGRFCLFCAKNKLRSYILLGVERFVKEILFRCRMCGDCSLSEATYLCPHSGCPKRLINGPCGGSRNGFCEVFPERSCFWVRVYARLEPDSTIETLTESPSLPPRNWAMEKTSSWINYFKKKSL